MNDLERLRQVWQTLGREDPLWAVLSHSDKRGGRWKPEEFLATGRAEIDAQLQALAAHGLPVRHRLALDFGCGAGRLSRALAAHFEHVVGIDVAASMIETARRLNADIANVEFRENTSRRLESIADGSVDFVYSNVTLQHIPADLAAGYVDEFFRVLAPGGVAVFQFVAGPDESLRGRMFARIPNRWLNPLRRLAWRQRAVFEMHALDENELTRRIAREPALYLLVAVDDVSAGPGWRSRRWYVVRRDEAPGPQT
ncbi:MAG TPA: methyltransferase domain-containing protein [Rhodanobacteraceae bacterium]